MTGVVYEQKFMQPDLNYVPRQLTCMIRDECLEVENITF